MTEMDFTQLEGKRRLSAYRVDDEIFAGLTRMNELLAAGESYTVSGNVRPNLFIFGLPRSGTTLLYQLLAYSLDIGYISNLAARFWMAPRTGAMLAQSVLGDRRDGSFQSDYGKSLDPSGPHEFSYFWQQWLNMRTVEAAVRFSSQDEQVDWPGLCRVLCGVQDVFQRGLVHKTNWVANVAGGVARHLPMPLFIYIERSPLAVALSILKARHAYYGRPDTWWATYPPSYPEIQVLPFAEQIARQVVDLRATYRMVLDSLDPALVVRLHYDTVCCNPAAVIEEICERVRRSHGVTIDLARTPPGSFHAAPPARPDTPEEQAVADALADVLEGRP